MISKNLVEIKSDVLAGEAKTISIIIVNYNLAEEIDNCLTSISENTDLLKRNDTEIIIVDNCSPDKGLTEIEKKFKKDNIHFFYLDENVGFGKGCNFGFSKSSGKYLCFLNPDTLIKNDIFKPIIELLESDKTIGILAPRQQVKSSYFDFSAGFSPNLFFEIFNVFGVGVFLEGMVMSYYAKLRGESKLKVNWILGAAIFVKSELFESVGGFDKDYFMFFEEVDLCRRIMKKGFNIIYYPKLAIHHIGSVSGKKNYKLYTIRTYSSKYIYISKHFTGLYKFVMKFLIRLQLVSQLIIWTFLFPLNKQKSKQKIEAFIFLLTHKVKYEHRY